jgi:ABC-type sugar transport system ATPase subunit
MVTLENVCKRFAEREVLRNVSLTLGSGDFGLLLGPSGAGKTVLLSLIAGLDHPSSGRVLIDGQDMARVPPERRAVTMVFQHHALFPHLTVFENVAFSLRARGFCRTCIKARVDELLERTRLSDYGRSRPGVLSGGQCQRVAFARALASDASVILFDEPLNSLDCGLREALIRELKQLHAVKRFTALYVTHDRKEAKALGASMYTLRGGVIEHE